MVRWQTEPRQTQFGPSWHRPPPLVGVLIRGRYCKRAAPIFANCLGVAPLQGRATPRSESTGGGEGRGEGLHFLGKLGYLAVFSSNTPKLGRNVAAFVDVAEPLRSQESPGRGKPPQTGSSPRSRLLVSIPRRSDSGQTGLGDASFDMARAP